ncbi:MAG TPA: TfuA-like protein, partial [Candidatus Acidoferrum sp.]|nr:TfuA-like protein [Candidatus Acidoferrum sp.]
MFIGPTLSPEDAAATLDAIYLPPVQQGDVYRATMRHHPRAIGIIDGYFEHVPSVWHKEILWAMAEGTHVFGSASMGALRAAELAAFGMRGVGKIFEAYRTGVFEPYEDEVFEDEDEVAIVHAPGGATYREASEAMVNIRSTLTAAANAGVISLDTRNRLVRIAKQLFYPERSWSALLHEGGSACPESEIEAMREWLPRGHINQKRDDALAMLVAMREFLAADPAPARATFVFQGSEMWQRAIADFEEAGEQDASGDAEREALFDELRLAGTYAEARRAGVLRWAGLRGCAHKGHAVSTEDRQSAELAFRDRFEISRRLDI